MINKRQQIALVTQPIYKVNFPTPQDSIGIYIQEVARRLARWYEVIVYAPGDTFFWTTDVYEGVTYKYVPIKFDRLVQRMLFLYSKMFSKKIRMFETLLPYLSYAFGIALNLRVRKIEVVQLFNFSQIGVAIKSVSPRTKIVLRMSCEWLNQLDEVRISSRIRKTDLVIGCSDYITNKIRNKFPQYADRCRTVYNGRDVEFFSPANDACSRRSPRQLVILFVGRISPEKGVHILLDAFQSVHQSNPKTRLVLVGGVMSKASELKDMIVFPRSEGLTKSLEPLYENWNVVLEHWCQTSPAAESTSFTGPLSHVELLDYYRRADIFVFPSIWNEPSGNPPIEAMAVGVPVISTDTGGTGEYVEHGKTGYLIEPNNAEALASAMAELLKDPCMREQMGRSGRARAVKCFSWERVVNELVHQYTAINSFRS